MFMAGWGLSRVTGAADCYGIGPPIRIERDNENSRETQFAGCYGSVVILLLGASVPQAESRSILGDSSWFTSGSSRTMISGAGRRDVRDPQTGDRTGANRSRVAGARS